MKLNEEKVGGVQVFFRIPEGSVSNKLKFNLDRVKKPAVSNGEPTGKNIFNLPGGTVCTDFFKQIESAGLALCEATIRAHQPSVSGPNSKKMVVVGLYFSRDQQPSGHIQGAREYVMTEIENIAKKAMWTVEGYLNPLYVWSAANFTMKEEDGKISYCIVFKSRRGLFDEEGLPIQVWRNINDDKRLGRWEDPVTGKPKKINLEPKYVFEVTDGEMFAVE